jgi:hypothetical protein
MKRIVDVYVESISGSGDYSKLELFNDEKIELTSSIQNIQDISKVYTDFTQSFTIPASPVNNAILHHFYQSDVDVATTNGEYQWNFNFRIRARIEVGLTTFRTGTIMVEKSEIKNGRPDNYTITFYGDLLTLKDKFEEFKLSDLDLTPYNVSYTATEVINKVTSSTQQDIMYPLISSKRVWTYNDGVSTDIKTSAGAVNFNELFPAIKVSILFDLIQSKFGITFNSDFFKSTNEKWDKIYLWLKNEEAYTLKTSGEAAYITYPSTGTTNIPSFYGWGGILYPVRKGFNFDLSTNAIKCQNLDDSSATSIFAVKTARFLVTVSNLSSATTIYYIDLYRNGKVVETFTYKGAITGAVMYTFTALDNGIVFNVIVRSDTPLTMNLQAAINYPTYNDFYQGIVFSPIETTATLDISSKIPDIKIADFFSGILKMFNATCYATDTNVFTIEPLDLWYNKGAIYDITEYTDTDSITIEKPNVYKKISFKYEKSESFMNRNFYDTNIVDREYSNTNIELQNEGSELTISAPFESLLMNNFNEDDFQVGYCLTKAPDYKPYIPKPVLFYYNGRINDTLYLNNGVTSTLYNDFNIFSNALDISGVKYSLTWHPENDVKAPNLPLTNNLYSLYYQNYLQNIFNPKCRLVRVKSYFPLSLITKLKLNDRLIIRDKRYIINEIKSDITSGQVDLSLLNDFRSMVNNVVTPIVPDDGGTIPIDWGLPNGSSSASFSSPIVGVSFSPSVITESASIDVTIPANTNTPTPIVLESGTDRLITEDGWGIVNEEGQVATIPVYATNTNSDGTTSIYDFYITQS